MRAVHPGKPEPRLQAICTGCWDGRRLVTYITGNAFVILDGAGAILQTIYEDDTVNLTAIAIDETSGKIATASGANVHIYKPYGLDEGALKWSLQSTISSENSEENVETLSWGSNAELLIGCSSLSLYSTDETPEVLWKKSLANVVKFAELSYDSSYIVSTGKHDRLAKVWRRLAFGADDVRFDFSYLPHPSTITQLHWRRPRHLEQTIDNVLYTISTDNVVRIWATTDPHGLQILQLWAQIDLQESIKPRRFPPAEVSSVVRYVFIIDGREFTRATETAIQKASPKKVANNQALEHLIEVANRSPEICVVLDDRGHMSAWGLENIGCKSRTTKNIFNIAHIEGLDMRLSRQGESDSYVQLYNYCNKDSGKLSILIHHFDGRVEVFESDVAEMFDPLTRSDRVVSKALWTGHSGPIKKIVRNVSGEAAVSRTDDNECIVWRHLDKGTGTALTRQSTISRKDHIHRVCVLREGQFIILLHHDSLTLWDTRLPAGVLLASCKYSIVGKPLCILLLPEMKYQGLVAHVATITTSMKGIVWEVRLPKDLSASTQGHEIGESFVREFSRFDLGGPDDLANVLPVDPAGSPTVISGFLDTFARDVAISYTHSGLLRSWTAKVDSEKGCVDWLLTSSVETSVEEPALVSASSIRKATLVNSTRSDLTIWDTKGGQLEYSQSFEAHETIQDLDWTSTPDDQSILAVGFPYRVLLLAQMRYDYIDKGSAWSAIQEINIRELTTYPIGDSTWLSGGNLLIGSGNQLFVYDKAIDVSSSLQDSLRLPRRKHTHWDLFEVVTRLNGPLPIFHPQFLGQCILAGKTALVQRIILALHKTLKYHIEGEVIDNLLGIDPNDFYYNDEAPSKAAHKEARSSAFADFSEEEDTETLTENIAFLINEKLTTIAIPQLSGHEQIHLADIIECVAIVEKQRRSLDDNAARFMLLFRQHALRRGRAGETNLSWREINWAYHSNSQEILVDMISRQFHGKMLWEHARESGIFMWIRDPVALKAQFEAIARNEYTKSDTKNPVDCSLFYLALKKKTVLQGLWRMAGWNREQGATQKLLANNFQDPKWRTAALKNAYALLGKRRFAYAAAFFLLADHLQDAITICLSQLKDLQLAITITRIYEGNDQGPHLRTLLLDRVLPLAAQEGNRYLASWAFWMLHRRDMAVLTLVQPIYTLLNTSASDSIPDQATKSFLTDDPALVILYSQLRQKTLQTLKGATQVLPKVEWNFIMHNARLYDRMGCDLLALDLVRNWEFLNPPELTRNSETTRGRAGSGNKAEGIEVSDPRKLVRRRSSLVVNDNEEGRGGLGLRSAGGLLSPRLGKQPPSVFEEPEGSSLLDSFGF